MCDLPSISVVICCYNSVSRLPSTLSHLLQETTTHPRFSWEIIIVDNASTDGTREIGEKFANEYSRVEIKIITELKPGQSHARLAGARLARYEYLLFVDDDNWLAPDYLLRLAHSLREHPEIGAMGGISTAITDGPEPKWLPRHQRWYAVNGPGGPQERLEDVTFLWGACLAVKRDLFHGIQLLDTGERLSGRQGASIPAGEDHELCHLLRALGAKLVVNHSLHFHHYLPERRLTWSYLRELHHAAGLVSVHLDRYRLSASVGGTKFSRLQRLWPAQMCYVSLQILRNALLFAASLTHPGEDDDRILKLDLYKGRLVGLWKYRNEWTQGLTRARDGSRNG